MMTAMNTKPLARLILATDPYRVPSESHGHEVGLALVLALRSARLRRRGLRLARDYSGHFLVRQIRSPNIILGQTSGPLPEVLKPRILGYGLPQLDREAGIPESSAQISTAGVLLLRLFALAERGQLAVDFDFRPWEIEKRRYRVVSYLAGGGRYGPAELPLARASSAEEALLGGLAFLASGPAVG
jgi:hypothetical protein